MRSLQTKLTLMTVIVLIITVVVMSVLSVIFIRNNELRKSDQLLLLLCETGEKNLDYFFNSTQKSVDKVASYVEVDLDGLDDESLGAHVGRVREYFDTIAGKTYGVLTYYYRIDPEISDKVKGFWCTDVFGVGFVEHEVTDISLYDTSDTSSLVWFTVPKNQGKPIWLPPYITDNLDKRVISYNVPVYYKGDFVGVIGIEIDYTTMAEQIDSIKLFSNGYAFLSDAEGNLFYHPRIDVTQLTPETMPKVPDGALKESTFIRYTFEGVEKAGVWLPLSNGMRINVAAPISETEGDWQKLLWNIMIVAIEAVAAASVFTMFYNKRIVKPLVQLTEAAEQVDRGNYEMSFNYDKNDEVGKLAKTFKLLTDHMKDNIRDLNKKVYIDALTKVKNKGAYSAALDDLQQLADNEDARVQFSIGVFDCDDLKTINDKYGHDRGDEYLKAASQAISKVFRNSPVYRVGGDEFSVILKYEECHNKDMLIAKFEQEVAEINNSTSNPWEQVQISMGFADYNPNDDDTVADVMRRADRNMYDNKRLRKKARRTSE